VLQHCSAEVKRPRNEELRPVLTGHDPETIVFGAILAEPVRKTRTHALASVDTRSRQYLAKALAAHDMSARALYAQRIRTFLHGVMHDAAASQGGVQAGNPPHH
jgi:hypothetical protein